MTGYLLDTSVVNRLGRPVVAEVVERRAMDRALYSCAVVKLEVLYSATSSRWYRQQRAQLEAAFADLPVTAEVMAVALDIHQRLAEASQHRGVGLPDLIIAACALLHDATVLHYDRDYDRVAAVTHQAVEWVVPAGSVD